MSVVTSLDPGIRPLERSRTRTLPPTNASAEFILSSIALAENSRYVAEYDQFVPVEDAKRHEEAILKLWDTVALEKSQLLAAMELLQQKIRPKALATSEEERQTLTWKNVISEVQTASDAYKKSIFARMCDKSETFEHWLALLPAGDYASTISGAFIIGVQAARAMSGVQKAIYEALASIPDTLSHASAYVEIYRAHSSDALVQKTAQLCKGILILLRLIVEFFLKSSWRRGATAIIKGSAYQQELTDAILEMKGQALQLREEANLCLQKRIAEMDKKSDLRASREQYRHDLAKQEFLLAIDSSTEITAQKVCTYLLRQLQSNPEFSVRTGGPISASGAGLLLAEEECPAERTSTAVRKSVTIKSLFRMLSCDIEDHQDDIEYCLALGFTQSQAFQDRAAWVLRSPELASFIAGDAESKFLMINGNHDATQFISPLSYVCAKIADLIMVSTQVIVITYFCSRHTDQWREPRANATGLIANLTAQLLNQVKKRKYLRSHVDMSSLTEEDYCAIQAEDLAATYKLFQAIIKQLPKGTVVFCLIDGISAYENSERREDTFQLVQKLSKLVRKSKSIIFKCMMTFPGRANYTEAWDGDPILQRVVTLDVLQDL